MFKYLDPKADIVFKKIFGQHPNLLRHFLNNVMPFNDASEHIVKIDYQATEQLPRLPVLKNTVVDVKCTDQKGRVFIVEMQMQWHHFFKSRLLYNTSKAIVNQLDVGKDYQQIHPVYGLALVNDVFHHEGKKWFHHYRLVEREDTHQLLKGLELIFVELPKFQPKSWNDKRLGVLWLRFLREMKGTNELHVPKEFMEVKELKQAVDLLAAASYSKAELAAYEQYCDAVMVENSVRKEGFAEGKAEGKAEGEQIGLEKGKAEGEQIGLEKGKAEGIKAVALNMLKLGMKIEDITQATGLSKQEIESL